MTTKKVPFCLRPFIQTLEPFSCYQMFVQLLCTRRHNIITSPKAIKIKITLGRNMKTPNNAASATNTL